MNKPYDRAGALFQGAYQRKHVSRDEYLVHLSRYIHLNPVMDGLVERCEDWEFSSYQEYIGQRNGTLPRPEIVLGQFLSVDDYGEFVESYVADDRAIIDGLLFGETRHQTSGVSRGLPRRCRRPTISMMNSFVAGGQESNIVSQRSY